MRRYALREDQWDRIKDMLPGREGHVGGTAADNRLFVETVLYRCRAGIPWPGLPPRFGNDKIIHQRFGRWAKSGGCDRIPKLLASDADNDYVMLDATIVRARQQSAGARTGGRPSHRAKLTTFKPRQPSSRRSSQVPLSPTGPMMPMA